MNVFIFWVGEEKRISKIIESIKAAGGNPVIGPSKEDDIFLEENFNFYKEAKEKGIYSFMSDIWRMWIFKTHKSGLYIDATGDVYVDKLAKFISRDKEGVEFIGYKEDRVKIASCAFYYNYTLSPLICEAYLSVYRKFKRHIYRFPIAPHIMTIVIRQYINKNGISKKQDRLTLIDGKSIHLRNLSEIVYVTDNNFIGYKKLGLGSWGKEERKTFDHHGKYWETKAVKQSDDNYPLFDYLWSYLTDYLFKKHRVDRKYKWKNISRREMND